MLIYPGRKQIFLERRKCVSTACNLDLRVKELFCPLLSEDTVHHNLQLTRLTCLLTRIAYKIKTIC